MGVSARPGVIGYVCKYRTSSGVVIYEAEYNASRGVVRYGVNTGLVGCNRIWE